MILAVAGSFAQETASLPENIPSIFYPPIARVARVSGEVEVVFAVEHDGNTSEVKAASGPVMLQTVAVAAVQSWHFSPDLGDPSKRHVFFVFSFIAALDDENSGGTFKTSFAVEAPDHLRITAMGISDIVREGCPKTASDRWIPQGESQGDYVETGWPRLKIESSGRVLWNPPGEDDHPDWQLAKTAEIDAAKARTLLESFRQAAFWKLCGGYSRSVTDSGSSFLKVSLGGVTKQVGDYAGSAPETYDDLLQEVHAASDSHRWRVGDPKHERMGDISADAWLPKPGRTGLMAKAYHGKFEDVRAAVEAGADVNAKDDSGWTALMYAAAGYAKNDVTKYLLAQHADVNTRGLQGETALQFSSLGGDADELLLKAGADVNARGEGGVTAIMLLAQNNKADEMAVLIAAGANPNAEDDAGLTAMDYLLAAGCGREIMPRNTHPWMTLGYGSCNALDDADFSRAQVLLQNAHVKPKKVWVASGLLDPMPR